MSIIYNFVEQIRHPFLFNLYFKKVNFCTFLHIFFRYLTIPLKEIEKYIPKQGRLLDFGCGYGMFSSLLHISSKQREIIGIDIDCRKIDIANKTNPGSKNVVFLNKSISALKEKKFDAVVVIDVLYLISPSARGTLLKAFYGILKSDGVLVIKIMDPRLKLKFFWNHFQEFISVKITKITKTNDKKLYFIKDMNYFKSILRELMFNVEEVKLDKGFLYPHILVVCQKQIREQ